MKFRVRIPVDSVVDDDLGQHGWREDAIVIRVEAPNATAAVEQITRGLVAVLGQMITEPDDVARHRRALGQRGDW